MEVGSKSDESQQAFVEAKGNELGTVWERMSFQDLESGRPLTGRRDPSNGRQDPTQAIVAGLFQITTAVRNFERLVNTIGTPKDTPELREKL
ncbi:hypothetical protein GW17_00001201 [Ensete ventricosum]|nr:hypothetical protein GW17_00001201 [Ensete ventricosum]